MSNVYRWYASDWFGYKVGVTVRESGMVTVIQPGPLAEGDRRLEAHRFEDLPEAVEFAKEFRAEVEDIMRRVDARELRRDNVSINQVLA